MSTKTLRDLLAKISTTTSSGRTHGNGVTSSGFVSKGESVEGAWALSLIVAAAPLGAAAAAFGGPDGAATLAES